MGGWKALPKSKGREKLHRGLWPRGRSFWTVFQSFLGHFGLCWGEKKRRPLWAAEVDVRGAGWRIEELRCPCFNDTRQKIPNL